MEFSVTVPTGLVINKDAKGNHVCATEAVIKNNTVGSVVVTNVDVTGTNGWTVAPWSTDMQNERVNTKKVAMTLNKDVTGDNTLVFDESNWGVIDGNGQLPLTYEANTPAQDTQVNGQVADITITVGWNEVAIIPDGGTYYEGVAFNDYHYETDATYTAKYTAGEEFPLTVKDGDVYVYGDYEYRYNVHKIEEMVGYETMCKNEKNPSQNGWGVCYVSAKDASHPADILDKINNVPVTSISCFYSSGNLYFTLETTPLIPDTVKDMQSAFADCNHLKTITNIPKYVENFEDAFRGSGETYETLVITLYNDDIKNFDNWAPYDEKVILRGLKSNRALRERVVSGYDNITLEDIDA